MAEVVSFTTSRLNDADLKAIAVYLKDLPGPEAGSVAKPADAVMQAGAGIFSDQCQACHNEGGAGVAPLFAPLKGNAGVQARDPTPVQIGRASCRARGCPYGWIQGLAVSLKKKTT